MKRLLGLLSVVALLTVSFPMASHAGWFLEDYSDVNDKIADANTNRLTAFANGMATCGNNTGCQIALSMAFASNMGQQQFFKPESWKDFLLSFYPYADLTARTIQLYRAGSNGDSSGIILNGDNNQVSGVGNKIVADRQSSASASFSAVPNINHVASYDSYNGDYTYPDPTAEGK